LISHGISIYNIRKAELLQDELLDRKQFLLFNRNVKKNKKQADKRGVQDIDYHNYLYKIEQGVLNYLHQNGELVTTNNLPALNHHLDIYYILQKLSLHVTKVSVAVASNQQSYDVASMKAVLELSQLPAYASTPLIQIYLAIVQMMEDRKQESYEKMLDLLKHYGDITSPKDSVDFYSIATVFCVHEIVKGNLIYNRKLFELYQIMHEKNLLQKNGIMDASNLKNLVTISCKVDEFAWATQMIENYRTSIEQSARSSVCHFNLGAIAFYQNDYKTAISHFIRVDKVNTNYDINCRTMLLKSHYETDIEYDERTMQIFRSAEKFMHDNKSLHSTYKIGYKNFIRLLINLYRIRHRATKITLERLKQKLEQMEFISDKHWLVEKMKELG